MFFFSFFIIIHMGRRKKKISLAKLSHKENIDLEINHFNPLDPGYVIIKS